LPLGKGVNLKKIILIQFLLVTLLLNSKTFIREYTYNAGDADSKITSRAIALEEVQRLLLQEIGVYVYSTIQNETTEVSGELRELTSKQVEVMTAGVTQTTILKEKWNGEIYFIKAEIEVDDKDVLNNLDKLLSNDEMSRQLEESRRETQLAYNEIARLSEELAKTKDVKKLQEIQKEYQVNAEKLTIEEAIKKSSQLAMNEEFIEAKKILEDISPDYPESTRLNYALGTLSVFNAEYEEAIKYFNLILHKSMDNAPVLSNLAYAYLKAGDYDNSLKFYNKAFELDSNSLVIVGGLAIYYDLQNDFPNAEKYFKKASLIVPDDLHILTRLGWLYHRFNYSEKAIATYKQALKFYPEVAEIYYWIGLSHERDGNMVLAEEAFEQARKLGYVPEETDENKKN